MVDAEPSRVGEADGAHSDSMPVAGCPNATTLQPPGGGSPLGTNTVPDTCGCPSLMPDVET